MYKLVTGYQCTGDYQKLDQNLGRLNSYFFIMILRKTGLIIFSIMLSIWVMLPVSPAQAVGVRDSFKNVLGEAGLVDKTKSLPTIEDSAGKIIFTVLTYVGVATIMLIIYAGALWATARGVETQIEKSKKILIGAIIGLIIIFTAAALTNFVLSVIGGPPLNQYV